VSHTPRKVKTAKDDFAALDVGLPNGGEGFELFARWHSPTKDAFGSYRTDSQGSMSGRNDSQGGLSGRNDSQGSLSDWNESQGSSASLPAATCQLTLNQLSVLSAPPIILKAGTYDIVLVLDKREKKSHKNDAGYIAAKLSEKGIIVDCRVLELGDVMWVAREKHNARSARELVLDWAVERKAIDDLRSSIFEGRFDEQRMRLSSCGLANVSFLVEGAVPKQDVVFAGERGEHLKSIQSSMALLQVRSGFFVKHTSGLEQSLDYLHQMTNFLVDLHQVRCFFWRG